MLLKKYLHADIREIKTWQGIPSLIPSMPEQDLLNLKADISENGILTPLGVVKPGENFLLLDGRSRLKACRELGMEKIPVRLVPATCEEDYAVYVLVKSAFKAWALAGQKAALATLLNERLVAARKNRASWERIRQFSDELSALLSLDIKTEKISARLFHISTSYLNIARKIRKQDESLFMQLLQGNISISEARTHLNAGHSNKTAEKSLGAARERIRLLEETQERIRKHLEVLLPFAKRALKDAAMESKYRFVLRPVSGHVLATSVRTGDERLSELNELKRQVAELEAENLLLCVRHDDPQQIALVHALCIIKSTFELPSVQDALEIIKSVSVITEDVLNEFYKLLTRTINFATVFLEQLNRISLSTPAHLDQSARDELEKHVEGRPAETAFEVPALRNTARQQLVIYTRRAKRDAYNYPVNAEHGE